MTVQVADDIRWNLDLRGEKKVQKGLNDTGDAFDELGDQAETAGKKSDKAGGKFKDTASDAGHLSRKLDEAAGSYQNLIRKFNENGDESLLKDIGKERRNLRRFQNLAKDLVPDEAAIGVGKQIMTGIASAATKSGPATIALAGLGVAVAPLIGASVAGAVLGGVGAGGIAGGIALAAQDPAVQSAAQGLAASVGQAFSSNGETFVGPVVEALDKLATTGVGAADKLKPGMDALAGTIVPLTDGIDGLVDNALPGLTQGLKAAAPVLRVVAAELPALGQHVGDFFSTISEDPDGAILAMKTLFDVTGDVLQVSGEVISTLSSIFEWSVRAAAKTSGVLEDVYGWLPFVGDQFATSNDEIEGMLAQLERVKASSLAGSVSTQALTMHTYELGVAADDAADALNTQREAMSKLVDLELAAVGGTIAFERAIDGLAEARKENGKTLDLDTEKGRANTEEILRGIEAVKENAEREYDLAIAHGATAQEAEEAARKYRETFGKELREQIIRLFGNTKAVQDLLAELDKLNGRRITYTIVQQGGRTVGFKADGGIQLKGDEGVYRRAAGGAFRPGPIYKVGEHGPELLQFGAHGTVTNAVQSRAAMSGTSGGSSAPASGGAVAYLQPAPNMQADLLAVARLLIPMFQVVIAGQGGDVNEVLGTPTR